MTDAEHSEHLATGLEVLPWRGGAASEHELEGEGSGVPGLMGEGGLLLLGVERGDGGEVDAGVARDQGGVLAEVRRRDGAPHGQDGDADLAGSLYAHVRLHCWRKDRERERERDVEDERSEEAPTDFPEGESQRVVACALFVLAHTEQWGPLSDNLGYFGSYLGFACQFKLVVNHRL